MGQHILAMFLAVVGFAVGFGSLRLGPLGKIVDFTAQLWLAGVALAAIGFGQLAGLVGGLGVLTALFAGIVLASALKGVLKGPL